MSRLFYLFTASLLTTTFLLSGTAMAQAGPAAGCAHYGGYASIETKLGNERDITEGALFLPVTCSAETLLFSDVRFKGDNRDNREGNIGLGIRHLQETGIIGGYAYFDRKKSGATDKYHNQATVGAEYLAETWEVRGNSYVPLNGEKVVGGFGAVASDPFLQGSGIFINQTAGGLITERGLWGGDIEAGYKVPLSTKPLWLHAALFSFSGEDTSSLDGARTRATWAVTDNISLLAEGQYDDERGRQGWVGARLSVPLGGQKYSNDALRARMTAAPVRDVDIVTTTTVKPNGPVQTGTVEVRNADSGTAQRIIYVDNSHGGTNEGTLENPYTTLAAAQAALGDNDILYIAAGLGDSTGMANGLTVSRDNVQVIGEGVDFVYDGTRLTSGATNNPNGFVLREAGTDNPVISNGAGDGVYVTGRDAVLTGFTVDGATQHGIHVAALGGAALGDVVVDGVTVRNNQADGIRIHADGATSSVSASLDNIVATNNVNGIRFYASDDGDVTAALQGSSVTANTEHGIIIYDDSAAGAVSADLGGGGSSLGGNAFFGNTFEDIAVDMDGAALAARGNWWGQATGAWAVAPDGLGNKPQIYYGAAIHDGLVGHWTFDNEWVSATLAYDRSGNEHNGSLGGGLAPADLTDTINRQAFIFDGLGSINLPFAVALQPAQGTLLAWVNTANAGVSYRGIIAQGQAHGLYLTSNVVGSYDNGTTQPRSSGVNVADSSDRFIGTTFNSGVNNGSTFYIDGAAVGTYLQTIVNNFSTPAIGRGQGGAGQTYSGIMDDVRMYNRILGQNEISEIYRADTSTIVDTGAALNAAP